MRPCVEQRSSALSPRKVLGAGEGNDWSADRLMELSGHAASGGPGPGRSRNRDQDPGAPEPVTSLVHSSQHQPHNLWGSVHTGRRAPYSKVIKDFKRQQSMNPNRGRAAAHKATPEGAWEKFVSLFGVGLTQGWAKVGLQLKYNN